MARRATDDERLCRVRMQPERKLHRRLVDFGVQDTRERLGREVLHRFDARRVEDDRCTREEIVAILEQKLERRRSPGEKDIDLSIAVLPAQKVAQGARMFFTCKTVRLQVLGMVHDLARGLPLEHRLNLLIECDRGRMLGAVPVECEHPSRLRGVLRPFDGWRYRLRLVRQPGFRRHDRSGRRSQEQSDQKAQCGRHRTTG